MASPWKLPVALLGVAILSVGAAAVFHFRGDIFFSPDPTPQEPLVSAAEDEEAQPTIPADPAPVDEEAALTMAPSSPPPAVPTKDEGAGPATLNQQLENLRVQVALVRESAPLEETEPEPPTTPLPSASLKRGGTIEEMSDDWLPPGVTRSE